jgi:hypothetical protein
VPGPGRLTTESRRQTELIAANNFELNPNKKKGNHRMLLRRKSLVLAGAFASIVVGATVALAPVANAAGVLAGNAEIVNPSNLSPLSSGAQSTAFQVRTKPLGGKCTGTSANGYFVYGYITPSTVDVRTLTFDFNGPHSGSPTDPTYPLVSTVGSPWIGYNTAPDGSVVISDPLNFAAFDSTTLPAGDYNIGMACASNAGTDRVWVGAIHINADLSWTVLPDPVIPEFPFAVALPVTAGAILLAGGLFEVRRRRRSPAVLAA